MRAWRDRDYLKCAGCGYILAHYTRVKGLRFGRGIEDVEHLLWRQGWRPVDGRFVFGRVRHGRYLDDTGRTHQGQPLPADIRVAVCRGCGDDVEVVD